MHTKRDGNKYSATIELPAEGNYIGIEGNNFTGTVNLNIK